MRASTLVAAGRRRGHARGFTLIEIIAVVMLIALATAIVVATIGTGMTGARIRSAGKDMVAGLRYTRTQAIVRRESQVFTIDVDKRQWQAPGRKPVEVPKELNIGLTTAAEEQIDAGVGRIRFFPDGSSTGGNIELGGERARWRIDIAWLTGEVVLRDLAREGGS